jgi:hypothetical protein
VLIAAVMLVASSAAFALFNITAVTMRQRQVPPELLGRVTSLSADLPALTRRFRRPARKYTSDSPVTRWFAPRLPVRPVLSWNPQ